MSLVEGEHSSAISALNGHREFKSVGQVLVHVLGKGGVLKFLEQMADKRLLISAAAAHIGSPETKFAAYIAEAVKIPFIPSLLHTCCASDRLHGSMLDKYLELGAVPIIDSKGEMALACANPDIISPWITADTRQQLRLALWKDIKAALENSTTPCLQDGIFGCAEKNKESKQEASFLDKSQSAIFDVVLIDDNQTFCRVVERFFKREGITIAAFGSSIDVLEYLKNRQIRARVIVSDVHMPDVDGLSIVRAIRNTPALNSIPVIILSSSEDVELGLQIIDAGADLLLTKRADPRLISAYVKRIIKRNR